MSPSEYAELTFLRNLMSKLNAFVRDHRDSEIVIGPGGLGVSVDVRHALAHASAQEKTIEDALTCAMQTAIRQQEVTKLCSRSERPGAPAT